MASRVAFSSRKAIAFISSCPVCGHEQLQTYYTRRALSKLLVTGSMVDAYCGACDVVWPISAEEKIELTAAITLGQRDWPSVVSQRRH